MSLCIIMCCTMETPFKLYFLSFLFKVKLIFITFYAAYCIKSVRPFIAFYQLRHLIIPTYLIQVDHNIVIEVIGIFIAYFAPISSTYFRKLLMLFKNSLDIIWKLKRWKRLLLISGFSLNLFISLFSLWLSQLSLSEVFDLSLIVWQIILWLSKLLDLSISP